MVKASDLTNLIYGDWKVVSRDGSNKDGRAIWQCECLKCGYQKAILGKSLVSKKATRCNECHSRAKDYLPGEKVGALVIQRHLKNDKHSFANWLCRCQQPILVVKVNKDGMKILEKKPCGKIFEVLGIRLRSGQKMCRECSSRVGAKKNQKDLSGQTFERLTVIEKDELKSVEFNSAYWSCECLCGAIVSVRQDGLTSGNSKSCGCLQSDVAKGLKNNLIHGLSSTSLYSIHSGVKQRCYNSNSPAYKYYGEKGISMSPEWKASFESFYHWANEMGFQEGMSIDRIDPNEGYTQENCQILSREHHYMKTLRDRGIATIIEGEQINLHEVSQKANIYSQTCRKLLEAGLKEEEILQFAKLQLHQKRAFLNALENDSPISVLEAKKLKKKIKKQNYPKEQGSFRSMLSRCYNPKDPSFKYYGGKGIGVDPRWILGGFRKFYEDIGPKEERYHIDRICVERDYSPENCRWLPARDNALRKIRGLTPEEKKISVYVPEGNLCKKFLETHGHPLANSMDLNILGVAGIKKMLELTLKGVFLSSGEFLATQEKIKSQKDLTGMRVGRLLVIERLIERDKDGRTRIMWSCLCECGRTQKIRQTSLLNLKTLSCGCLRLEKTSQANQKNKYAPTHGYSKEPFYRLWSNLKIDATSSNQSIDPNWLDIHLFKEWLTSQGYHKEMKIHLKEQSGGYNPRNCILALKKDIHKHNHQRDRSSKVLCPRCNDDYTVKNGKIQGCQRYQCKACKFNFVPSDHVAYVTAVT
ncbi:MAG: hypothetical protein K1000chlam2_00768 [Chlamydiae bacterium]|nr:hypothetical protein [Chlamydiota bacterium]